VRNPRCRFGSADYEVEARFVNDFTVKCIFAPSTRQDS
jgi:hypothetical protein